MISDLASLDLDRVAAAAAACPQVAELSGGRFGEVATYLPGHRVVGVRVVDGQVEVHVVAEWGAVLPEVADAVRGAVGLFTGRRPVAVFIEDIVAPGEATGESRATP